MADTTTVNDLSEKTSISDSDLLLITDSDGVGTKAQVSNLKANFVGGSVAAGNTLAPSGDTVNSALAELDKANLWSDTLLSICANSVTSAGKETVYTINATTISDLPVANVGIVKTRKNSANNRAIQFYFCNQSANNDIYYRYIEWSGTAWNVSIAWQKLIGETDLTSALAEVHKTISLTKTTDANGNFSTTTTELSSTSRVLCAVCDTKMVLPFKYNNQWVFYVSSVGGAKVASTEVTLYITYI